MFTPSFLRKPRVTTLVKITFEKIVEKIPIHKVNAKPLIGPSPNENKQTAAIRVVILASRIVDKDFSNPTSIAIAFSFPLAISSLILSYIIMFPSTAIPKVKTSPAIPGNVKVTPNNDSNPKIVKILKNNAKSHTSPNFL